MRLRRTSTTVRFASGKRRAYVDALRAWSERSRSATSGAELLEGLTTISPPRRCRESFRDLCDSADVLSDLLETGRGRESPAVVLALEEIERAFERAMRDIEGRIDETGTGRRRLAERTA